RRAADLVHVEYRIPRRARLREAGENVGMLLADVEPVERIEQREAVALRQQEWLPLLPGRLAGARRHRLDQDHARADLLPVAAALLPGKGKRQMIILEVLGIGQLHGGISRALPPTTARSARLCA